MLSSHLLSSVCRGKAQPAPSGLGAEGSLGGSCGQRGGWVGLSVAGAQRFPSLQVACEKTVSAMHHVLQRTIKCAQGTAGRTQGQPLRS